MQDKVNLEAKLALFTDHYSPRTVGTFNGHDLMVVKLSGPFTWHSHPDTDDFFLVLDGERPEGELAEAILTAILARWPDR